MRELRETAGERVRRLRRRQPAPPPAPRPRRAGARHDRTSSTALLERTTPDIVLVTIPNAPRERLDAVVDACAEADVDCRFVRREIDLDPRVVLGSTAE